MATDSLGAVNATFNGVNEAVFPTGPSSQWMEAIAAKGSGSVGGIETQDAATIVNPEATITLTTRKKLRRRNRVGSRIQFRLKYDTGISGSITSPVICVFGRTGTDAWQKLYSLASANTATLTIASSTDDADGTFKYTVVDPYSHVFDVSGCDEFIVGVLTAFNATGTLTNATLLAKFV